MVDNHNHVPASDNIRTLIYHLGLAIDERLLALRKGTVYEKARASDARVFVTAARTPSTISDIARELKITRQAAQMSVQRLIKLQVVALKSVPGNQRDKHVVVTPRGKLASNTAARQIAHIESELAAAIGADQLHNLRQNLSTIIRHLNDQPEKRPVDSDLQEF